MSDNKFISFLYLLARDHLTLGKIEGILEQVENPDEFKISEWDAESDIIFSNKHLEAYCKDICDRLK